MSESHISKTTLALEGSTEIKLNIITVNNYGRLMEGEVGWRRIFGDYWGGGGGERENFFSLVGSAPPPPHPTLVYIWTLILKTSNT